MKNKPVNSTERNHQSVERFNYKKTFIKIALLVLPAILLFNNLPELNIFAAVSVTGRVFQDFNGNGNYDTDGGTAAAPTAIDVGVAGVTVTAYNSSGAAAGTVTSGADGAYTLNTTGTGPYRIEFTTLPSGFQPSARSTDSVLGSAAAQSGSTVQFISDSTTTSVNLAVNRPEEYCQNNPNLATCRFNRGAQNATGTNGVANNPALQSFPYQAGTVYTDTTVANYDNPTTHTVNITASQIGSVFSLAYSRLNKRLYAAAYFKRYVGFGSGADGAYDTTLPSTTSDDSGAIYVINPANNTVVNRFVVPNALNNNHSNAAADDATDTQWNAVGKTSLGGMAMADDESRLFIMNLQDKNLYALNPTTGASLGNQLVPTPSDCTAAATDVRPFAVKYYRGNVYVGIICTAQTNQQAADLRAYVYQVNPTTLAFNTASFYSTSLNYNRGDVNNPRDGFPAEWRPWTTTTPANHGFSYPQPMLTDIDFDNGNMILGIRDRHGDQGDDASIRPGGDVLRVCGAFDSTNFPGTLALEANGRCGGTGNAAQNTGQGPGAVPGTAAGSGEFYYQDDFSLGSNAANYHDEVTLGTTTKLPGYARTVVSVFDPINRNISDQTFDGGFRWFNNTTGAADRAYRLYNDSEPTPGKFGKANGLGDVIALCDSAPIEIGNRVWRDSNSNGVQDPQESRAGSNFISLAGITVRLYNPANVLVGTAITDQDGEYYFTSGTAADPNTTDNIGIVNGGILPNTAYQIRFDNPADYAAGGILSGLVPTTANATAQAGDDDSSDSDAVNVTNPVNSPAGTFPVIAHTTGAAGANNHTLDVGFVSTASIGSNIFLDRNNNGLHNPNGVDGIAGNADDEIGIAGVTIELLYDADNNGSITGGELTAVATRTTDASGNYFFGNLLPGRYEIRIPATNFTGTGALVNADTSSANTDTADNGEDGDDNGTQASAGAVTTSPFIVLVLNGEPTGASESFAGGTQDDADDNDGDMTVDFGFVPLQYSLGNRVWFDTNNNGQLNTAEVGIANVSVSLFAATDTSFTTALRTVNTDSLGYYRFDNLDGGNYVVRINPSNFQAGGALLGYRNTTGNTTTDLDSTDTLAGEDGINPAVAGNGVQTNGIASSAVTLGGRSEPTGETDVQAAGQGATDNQANMTIDFGFYRLSLSGTVWNDNGSGSGGNNNGLLAGTEAGIPNVRVQIYSGTTEILVGPDGILGTADDAANGMLTNGSGVYNFQGLPEGTYRIVVTAPSGATSSTNIGTSSDPNNNVDSDDNGYPNTNEGFTGKIISGTLTLTAGSTGSAGNNTVTNGTGATSNPTVDFGFANFTPTVVKLDKFDVYTDGSSVELQWATGSEANNLGFNVYRETGGKRELLNAAPIAGNALRSSVQLAASGGEYVWTVKEAVPDAVYYLEDLDVDGGSTLHGAVTPQSRQRLDSQPNARTFNDLAQSENSVNLTESIGEQRTANPADDKLAMSAAKARQRQIATAGGAKITIKRDGWYRISAQQLQAAGFDTNTDPQLWQLYTDGTEVPFKLNSNSIEFFGRGSDTALTDSRIYYLVRAQTAGMRINAVEGGAAGANADARSFGVTVERKDRQVYVSSLLNGEADNWFGAVVSRNIETVQNLNAVNVDENGAARLSVKLQGIVAGEHLVSVRFNDAQLGDVEFTGFENKEFEFDLPAGAVREGVNRIVLQANGAGSDASLVDAIRLSYQRGYTAQNNQLRFTVPANQSVLVGGFTDANISVYEIGGGAARQQVIATPETFTGGYGFSLGAVNEDRELIAVVNDSVASAAVENNAPSAWYDSRNAADFVIVTADELRESAASLAAMRQNQGLQTKVVLIEDLFDEFTFGRRDPNAVKKFLRTATTEWQTKPRYALLFGDASYDTRNNLGLAQTRDIVPTKLVDTEFMETSSDAWLGDFDNDGAEDIALGRIPVGNASEAAAAVQKLVRFDAQGARQEKTNVLVADNGFAEFSQALQTLVPRGIASLRIDRGALPDAETHGLIVEHLNRNPLMVTYTGHGSQSVWATNGIFNSADAAALRNTQLSFYLLMNCLNGYTNQPTGESLAETLFKNPHGAIAVWTSSGVTNPGEQGAISQAFTRLAFNARAGKSLRVGDVAKTAKRATNDADVRRTWQLVGDPTVFVR